MSYRISISHPRTSVQTRHRKLWILRALSTPQPLRGDQKVAGGKRVLERNHRFRLPHNARTPEGCRIHFANL
jgi:hypothetical protein